MNFNVFRLPEPIHFAGTACKFSQPSPLQPILSNSAPLLTIYKGQPPLQYLKHKEPFKKGGLLFTISKKYIKARKDKKKPF